MECSAETPIDTFGPRPPPSALLPSDVSAISKELSSFRRVKIVEVSRVTPLSTDPECAEARTSHKLSVSMGDGNADCCDITNNFNSYNTYNNDMSDEHSQILRWLSPLEPNKIHQGVCSERFNGVGDWILQMKEFGGWIGSEGGV